MVKKTYILLLSFLIITPLILQGMQETGVSFSCPWIVKDRPSDCQDSYKKFLLFDESTQQHISCYLHKDFVHLSPFLTHAQSTEDKPAKISLNPTALKKLVHFSCLYYYSIKKSQEWDKEYNARKTILKNLRTSFKSKKEGFDYLNEFKEYCTLIDAALCLQLTPLITIFSSYLFSLMNRQGILKLGPALLYCMELIPNDAKIHKQLEMLAFNHLNIVQPYEILRDYHGNVRNSVQGLTDINHPLDKVHFTPLYLSSPDQHYLAQLIETVLTIKKAHDSDSWTQTRYDQPEKEIFSVINFGLGYEGLLLTTRTHPQINYYTLKLYDLINRKLVKKIIFKSLLTNVTPYYFDPTNRKAIMIGRSNDSYAQSNDKLVLQIINLHDEHIDEIELPSTYKKDYNDFFSNVCSPVFSYDGSQLACIVPGAIVIVDLVKNCIKDIVYEEALQCSFRKFGSQLQAFVKAPLQDSFYQVVRYNLKTKRTSRSSLLYPKDCIISQNGRLVTVIKLSLHEGFIEGTRTSINPDCDTYYKPEQSDQGNTHNVAHIHELSQEDPRIISLESQRTRPIVEFEKKIKKTLSQLPVVLTTSRTAREHKKEHMTSLFSSSHILLLRFIQQCMIETVIHKRAATPVLSQKEYKKLIKVLPLGCRQEKQLPDLIKLGWISNKVPNCSSHQ